MRTTTLIVLVLGICAVPLRGVGAQDTAAQLARARILREGGDTAAAEALLERLLKQTPEHAAARLMLAEILADRRAWDQADALLRDLPGRTLGYPLHHVRGRVLLNRGHYDAARRDLEKALRYRPRSGVDCALLAEADLRGGCWALAIEAYARAQACGYDDAALHLGLARAYCAQRTYLGAVTSRKLRDAHVGRIRAGCYVLAPAPDRPGFYQVCPPASAVYQVAAARRLGAEGVSVDLLEADIWLATARFDRARTLYAAIEPKIDGSQAASFYERFSRVYRGLGDSDRYLRLLRKAAELDPKAYKPTLAHAHTAAAEQAAAAGDLSRGLYHLKRAVAAAPESADLHRRLGDAFAEQGNLTLARVHWREALRLRPDDPDRGAILRRLQRAAAEKAEK